MRKWQPGLVWQLGRPEEGQGREARGGKQIHSNELIGKQSPRLGFRLFSRHHVIFTPDTETMGRTDTNIFPPPVRAIENYSFL